MMVVTTGINKVTHLHNCIYLFMSVRLGTQVDSSLKAAGTTNVQLKRETKSLDGAITKLESENAKLTSDLEVLLSEQKAKNKYQEKFEVRRDPRPRRVSSSGGML